MLLYRSKNQLQYWWYNIEITEILIRLLAHGYDSVVSVAQPPGEWASWGVAYIARWKKMSEASDSEKGSYIQTFGFLRAT